MGTWLPTVSFDIVKRLTHRQTRQGGGGETSVREKRRSHGGCWALLFLHGYVVLWRLVFSPPCGLSFSPRHSSTLSLRGSCLPPLTAPTLPATSHTKSSLSRAVGVRASLDFQLLSSTLLTPSTSVKYNPPNNPGQRGRRSAETAPPPSLPTRTPPSDTLLTPSTSQPPPTLRDPYPAHHRYPAALSLTAPARAGSN